MTNNKRQHDTFVLVPNLHIQVNSKSGNTYYITLTADYTPQCTCKGFMYYQKCRHIDEAGQRYSGYFIQYKNPAPQLPYNQIREHNLDIISGKAPHYNIRH